MADLFQTFLSKGVNELFASGSTFTSVASGLRAQGIRFADTRLRSFRDWSLSGGSVPGYDYGGEITHSPSNMKVSTFLEPGTYGYRVRYDATDNITGQSISRHLFEITDFYGTEQEILDYLIPRMIQSSIDRGSNVGYTSFIIETAYKSVLE